MTFTLSAVCAARMFDGRSAHPGPAMVLVKDGWIIDVDLTGALPPREGELIDLGDATLLPELVDAHSHLVFDPSGDAERQMSNDDDATVMNRMREHLAKALRAGVSTVRDLGDRGYLVLRLREELDEASEIHPKIVAAGAPMTRTRAIAGI